MVQAARIAITGTQTMEDGGRIRGTSQRLFGGGAAEFGEGVMALGGDQEQVGAERGPGVAPRNAGECVVDLAFQRTDGEVAGDVFGGRR